MSAKAVEKTRLRLQKQIEEGSYYEAHQALRVVCQRYIKSNNYDAAVQIVFSGAQSLLKAGQGGSGGDLCMLLVEVYKTAKFTPTAENKGRIYELLTAISPEEPARKRFINEAFQWSSAYGEYKNGDPDLHHFVGNMLAQEDEAYEAEKHLLLGTKDSVEVLANLHARWYAADDSFKAAHYAARAVLPYLLLKNIRDANRYLDIFASILVKNNPSLTSSSIDSIAAEVRVFPSLPLLNYLKLLVLACERGGQDLYRNLNSHYGAHLQEVPFWGDALEQIGEIYFDIKIYRQPSLMDMMSGLLGGGPSGGGRAGGNPGAIELD